MKTAGSAESILLYYHAVLITATNTFSQLMFKCLPAFVAYIMVDYSFTYSFTITALAIGSLSTSATFIFNPLILHLPTNIVFCIFSSFLSLSCLILWYFRDNKAFFIIGVIILSFAENSCYGCSLAAISTFTPDPNKSHKYLITLNSAWTIATFLFLGVGWIMNIGGIWLYLEIMFVIFVIFAVLSAVFLPVQSVNAYALKQSKSDLNPDVTVNLKDDLRVLWKMKSFLYLLLVIILLFIPWAYFYSSFSLWLKEVFHLNQEEFGYRAGFAEGFGNLFAILSVFAFTTSDSQNNDIYKMPLHVMMLWTALIIMISCGVIWVVNFVEWYNEIFIFVWIGIYFFGNEACICSDIMLMVNEVPALQQGRASAMFGVTQSLTIFFAQLTVAPMYFSLDGMKWETLILLIFYVLTIVDIIYLNKIMKHPKLCIDEMMPINKDKSNVETYT